MKPLYMIAIEPPAGLSEKIRKLQTEFSERFGSAAALKPPVHITFKPPFRIDPELLPEYKKSLELFCARQQNFGIELNGFDFFKKNRVVFISIMPNDTLQKMYRAFGSSEDKIKHPYHPHITIGYRNLTEDTFREILKFYCDLPFHDSFQVNGLNLWLRKGNVWENIAFFPFNISNHKYSSEY